MDALGSDPATGLIALGLAPGLIILILTGFLRRSDRPGGLAASGILSGGFSLLGASWRSGAPLLGVLWTVYLLSTLILRFAPQWGSVASAINLCTGVAAVFYLHRLFLLRDRSAFEQLTNTSGFGRVWLRVVTLLLYLGFYVGSVILIGVVVILIPFTPLQFAALPAVGFAIPFVSIWGARASFMIPAAATGRSGWIREAVDLSKGIGIQLCGALWMCGLLWVVLAALIWLMAPPPAGANPVHVLAITAFESAAILFYNAISIACVSFAYRESLRMTERSAPHHPESENAAPGGGASE
jgi:hypothetical protein